jgi:hypothetical protein
MPVKGRAGQSCPAFLLAIAVKKFAQLEFQLNNDKMNLLLVHGIPRRINEYLFEDREEKSTLRILNDGMLNPYAKAYDKNGIWPLQAGIFWYLKASVLSFRHGFFHFGVLFCLLRH